MSTYVLGENALRKLKAVFNATTIGVEDGPEARRLDDQDFVPAWTIKWASSLNSWIVWIPPSSAVEVSGRDLAALAVVGLTAAGGSYPAGWYKLNITAVEAWSTIYLNVTESTATLSVTKGASVAVPIARVRGTSNPFMRDVMQLQLGEIVIGGAGGSSVPGLFEPVFEGGVLSSVGDGLFPFGRQFLAGATLDESALVATGLIGIEISHGYGTPSAVIKKIADAFGEVRNADPTKTVLPLYMIENGAIRIDCRALLALAMRE